VATVTPPGSLAEASTLLRHREISAVELVEHALEVIEDREPELNAYVTIMRAAARRDARAADLLLAAGESPGPLVGIPFAVKDAFLTIDAPTTGGSSVFSALPSSADAVAVARLRRAGAVLVGKTNMNELGWGLDSRVGPVANPVVQGSSAGGSSGGSAATVATSAVTFALGTDGGGSVRMPAAFCGVVGVKPTHGAVPSEGMLPGAQSLTDPGPITTTAADARTILRWLTNSSSSTPDPEERPRLGILGSAVPSCKPLVAGPLGSALERLERLGCTIDVELNLAEAADAWLTTFSAESAAALVPALGGLLVRTSADLQRLVGLGLGVRAVDYLAAQAARTDLAHRLDAALENCDAILTPTVPSPPLTAEPAWEDEDFFGDMRWTIPANLTGHPAVTIPLPGAAEPAGLQLIGRRNTDDALLAVAEWVEAQIAHATDGESRADDDA